MSEGISNVVARAIVASAFVLALTACTSGTQGITNVTVTPIATLSAGSYVFQATGTDPTDGDYGVIGRFVADGNGNITSATADYNLGSGVDPNVTLTGTYYVTGTVLTVMLTDGKSTQDKITANLPGTAASSTITSFDGTGTGTLYPQVTAGFTPVGTYSFTLGGEANYIVSGSGQAVIVSGNTFASGTMSYFDGATTINYSSVTGFVYAPAANGRGQAALVGNDLSYYVIGPKQLVMMNLDSHALLLIPVTKS